MYGMKPEDMFVEKIGLTIMYTMVHIFIIGMASVFICSIFGFSQKSCNFAIFFCGYVTNTFVRTDIKEIWSI